MANPSRTLPCTASLIADCPNYQSQIIGHLPKHFGNLRQLITGATYVLGVSRLAVILDWDKLVIDLGGDPNEVVAQTDWDISKLSDPDSTLPTRTVTNILSRAADTTGYPHFGLLLAKRRDYKTHFGLLGQILFASETIGDALENIFEMMELHVQGICWELHTEGNVSHATWQMDEFLERGAVQAAQLALGDFWRLVRMLSDGRWHPTMVSFTFDQPEDTLVYKRFFDVPILFSGDQNAIIFHSEDLKIPLPRHDDYLLDILKRYAQTQHMSRRRNLADEVKDLVRKNLQDGKTDIVDMAKFFPFEQRTLQRKLNDLGTSYRQLLQDVRIETAQDRLLNSNVSIARVADALEYSDQGSFTKAFKNHTGLTPSKWRNQAREKKSQES